MFILLNFLADLSIYLSEIALVKHLMVLNSSWSTFRNLALWVIYIELRCTDLAQSEANISARRVGFS